MESSALYRPGPERSLADSADIDAVLGVAERVLLDDGDLATARTSFTSAALTALEWGDSRGLARAALGLGGLWVHEHRTAVDAARVAAWQRKALEQLDPSDPLAARLATRLAAEADYAAGTSERVLAAVDDARRGGDPIALAEALSLAHHCLLAPGQAAQRLVLAEELLGVAALSGRSADGILGLLWRTVDVLLAGDPHAERSLRELIDANDRHPMVAVEFVLSAIGVMQSIRRGDFDAAERQAATCAERGRAVGDADALGWYTAQLTAVRWFQGRIAEMLPLVRQVVDSPTLAGPDDSMYAALAVAAAAAGDRAEAVSAIRRLRRDGLLGLRPSSTWLVTVTGVVEAAALLGDADLAAEAYALLEPYAERPVMASLAVVCFGSVHHPLGVAALTMGDLERAVAHFQAAAAANESLGHRPALAASRTRLAEASALQVAAALKAQAACRREGGYWRLALAGREVVLPDATGVRYLAILLSSPGQEVSAAELAGAARTGRSPAEPVLDDEARAAYRKRVSTLQAAREQAEADGDTARADRAAAELDWVLAELERVTGLGGRSRGFADAAERARTSVQKAIRRALDRIAEDDPWLSEELRGDLMTGAWCCYRPKKGRIPTGV